MAGISPNDETPSSTRTALAQELRRAQAFVAERVRVKAIVDKCRVLALMAAAAEKGERRVPVAELAARLAERESTAPLPNTIRKSLIDLNRMLDILYAEHPSDLRVHIESNGSFSLIPNQHTSSESAFREMLAKVTESARRLIPWNASVGERDRWRYCDQESGGLSELAVRRWLAHVFGNEVVGRASDDDLQLVSRLLYDVTSTALAAAIHNFDPSRRIIAVEYHPTHNLDSWEESLSWLNDAYYAFVRRNGEIFRIVHISPLVDFTDENEAWWRTWYEHIEVRSDSDHIIVVADHVRPEWEPALSGDYLMLTGSIVARYWRDDFPRSFEALPASAIAARRVLIAAEHIIDARKSLLWIERGSAGIRSQLEEARENLRQRTP